MRAFLTALFLLLLVPVAQAQEKPEMTAEEAYAKLDQIEAVLEELGYRYVHSFDPKTDDAEVAAFVDGLLTQRKTSQSALKWLDRLEATGLFAPGAGGARDMRHIRRARGRATDKLASAERSVDLLADEMSRKANQSFERLQYLREPSEKVLAAMTSASGFDAMLEDVAESRLVLRRAAMIQQAFGADVTQMQQGIAAVDALEQRMRAQRETQVAGEGLPEAKSDDPEMMAAAREALARWVEKYDADETGPIVLTSEAIREGSRTEAGLKAGGDTNAKIEVGTYRWEGFVFWVPVRDGEDWHLYRMVARNYTQAPDLKTGEWRVWNDGKMKAISPAAWE